MKFPITKALASAAIAFATLGAVEPAAAATHAAPAWALVRVDVSAAGDLEGVRLRYDSGNRSFDRAALEAVSRAVFVPVPHRSGPAVFDYLVSRDGQGNYARIVPALAGYRGAELPPVRVETARATATALRWPAC